MSSLDDLLSYDDPESEHEEPTGPSRWRPVLIAVAVAAVGAGILKVFLQLFGAGVPYLLIFMVLLAVQSLARALRWIAVQPTPATLLRPSAQLRPADVSDPAPDGLYLATARWDTRLSWAKLQTDPAQFSRTVQPRLIELVDERLRLRHGLNRQSNPAAARKVLGEPLWALVSGPIKQRIQPTDLAKLISMMEAL